MTAQATGLSTSPSSGAGPRSVDFRRSFLRRHVPEVLRDTPNVLAIEAILKRAGGRATATDRDWLLEQFCLAGLPESRTWVPLRLRA
jgi:hypothetical protein